MTKPLSYLISISFVGLTVFSGPVWVADHKKDEDRLRNSGTVLVIEPACSLGSPVTEPCTPLR